MGMRERTSDGMRLMGTNEFLHSRMVANAIEVFSSSRETASKVNLCFEGVISVGSYHDDYADMATYEER